ncbi:197_t:CDS:2, partial [Funneliformis caledonium]
KEVMMEFEGIGFRHLHLSKLSTGDDVPTSKRKRKRGDYENFNS